MKSVICYLFSRIRGKKSFTLTTAQSPEAPAKQTPAAIPFLQRTKQSSHTTQYEMDEDIVLLPNSFSVNMDIN